MNSVWGVPELYSTSRIEMPDSRTMLISGIDNFSFIIVGICSVIILSRIWRKNNPSTNSNMSN